MAVVFGTVVEAISIARKKNNRKVIWKYKIISEHMNKILPMLLFVLETLCKVTILKSIIIVHYINSGEN